MTIKANLRLPPHTKEISQQRFEVFTLSKHPMARLMGTEVEWYSDIEETVIGMIYHDHTDKDWSYAVLGRDERSQFRYIDGDTSLERRSLARDKLWSKIRQYAEDGATVYPQGDAARKKNAIFDTKSNKSAINPIFLSVRDGKGHSPARDIIKEVAYAFVDLDGNFIQQFQSDGFNTRLWELYLRAFFHEEGFLLLDDHSTPDYHLRKWEDVFIEATTVNPSPSFDISHEPATQAEIRALMKDYMPIKFGSALYSKLKKKYWELPHVAGKALVFAIHDFHMAGSMTWSHSALMPYLYASHGAVLFDDKGNLMQIPEKIETHKFGNKEIPSGFFFQPDTENISAVLFSNSATISKFNRIGLLAGFGNENIKLIRKGYCYDHDPNATDSQIFTHEIEQGKHLEPWGEGISILHNPNALYPLDPNLFPSVAHVFMEDGIIKSVMPEFFPYSSVTHVLCIRDE